MASRVPCRAAAIFTTNQFPAASVLYNRQLLAFNPEMIDEWWSQTPGVPMPAPGCW